MSESGILSEFDPLTASKIAHGQPESQVKEQQASTTEEIISKSSVLEEFDPLAQPGGADRGQASNSVKQDSTAPAHSTKSPLTMSVSTSPSSNVISPHTSTQSHTGGGYQNGSSKGLGSAHIKVEQTCISKGEDVVTSAASQSGLSEPGRSDRIGAEINQIDSILKALNMGQFDLAAMSSLTAKSQPHNRPESSQPQQVHV